MALGLPHENIHENIHYPFFSLGVKNPP
jgi:hypothetical protein